jgi:transcriptional regulator with XRE-family HTH domain
MRDAIPQPANPSHNRLSSQLLSRLLSLRGWTELQLAEHSGIACSAVSAHLSGQRRIGSQHLAAYLKVLECHERAAFLSTWLRDNLDPELVADLLEGTKTDSLPGLQENQRRMLAWWATAIARDSGLAKILDDVATQSGFKFAAGTAKTFAMILPAREVEHGKKDCCPDPSFQSTTTRARRGTRRGKPKGRSVKLGGNKRRRIMAAEPQ